jgi:hypothetical protein
MWKIAADDGFMCVGFALTGAPGSAPIGGAAAIGWTPPRHCLLNGQVHQQVPILKGP